MEKEIVTHIRCVFDLLNREVEYAVLRNFEGLPANNHSRDVDIILRRRDWRRVRSLLVKLFEETGWSIVTYLKSDRLQTFVTGKIVDGQLQLMQWDFFFDTSVHGIRLMSADEFLSHRVFNGFLWHVDVPEQFLDKYLYNRAVGAQYPEKYAATRHAAESDERVRLKLRSIFGCNSAEEADSRSRRSLVFAALRSNLLHRPLAILCDLVLFMWTFASNYLTSHTGFSVAFTGPDGVGKTTVIDMLIAQTGQIFGKAHIYLHFRPTLFGNISDVAHKARVKKDVDRDYSRPHRGGRTGVLSSLARLSYYTVDYILGYFLKVKPCTRITRLVVFDRYYTDIMCDPRRTRIYLPFSFLRIWRRLFIPTLDYNILLTAPADTILSRKAELSREDIDSINDRIDKLSSLRHYYRVENIGAPSEAVEKILRIILDAQHTRNMRRV